MTKKRTRPSRYHDVFDSFDNSESNVSGAWNKEGDLFWVTKGPEDEFPSHPETLFSLDERLAIFKELKRRIAVVRDSDKAGERHAKQNR